MQTWSNAQRFTDGIPAASAIATSFSHAYPPRNTGTRCRTESRGQPSSNGSLKAVLARSRSRDHAPKSSASVLSESKLLLPFDSHSTGRLTNRFEPASDLVNSGGCRMVNVVGEQHLKFASTE